MPNAKPPAASKREFGDHADLAEAFKEISRGEQTASALERQLDTLENRIEDLLARADADQKGLEPQTEAEKPPADREGEQDGPEKK